MAGLRQVKYTRHEVRGEPEAREGSLLIFVYDVPYLPACGVLPPLQILNQVLETGGSQGGMSPGATWEPFRLSAAEYGVLIEALRSTPISEIKPFARYAALPMKRDPSFDDIQDRLQWVRVVCGKHRDAWQADLKKAEETS